MKNKYKILTIFLLTLFSFMYTNEVATVIRNNDPLMKQIDEVSNEYTIPKLEPVIMQDEYITGINGCKIDKKNSYDRMKNNKEFNEELIVMKQDEIENINDKYIIMGNNKKRNVSIVLTNIELNDFFVNKKVKVNYFLDGNYVYNNISDLIKINRGSNIYSFGRNRKYESKYIVYDNTVINTNFNNKSDYCLLEEKNKDMLELCSSYKMKTIKANRITNNLLSYTKENLSNGKIFFYDTKDLNQIKISINYILSKGYNIVSLDELLNQVNDCA